MSLPSTCVKRPVSVLMFYAGVLLFGIISLSFLRQELFPPISYPKLSIVTHYENAAPEEIENLITKPIEEAVGSTAGLKSMTSTSREGLSVVVAEFGWDQNMDFAALGVREKIDLMKSRLPRDSQEPTVVKFNPFELPVMTLSISSENRTGVRLKRFSEKWFKDEIEKISGVASAVVSGGEDEEILVAVDQGRLKASGIGVADLSKALAAANLNYPGGTIKESFYEYLVRTMGEFKKIDDIGKVPVAKGHDSQASHIPKEQAEAEQNPGLILLQDLAKIQRTVQPRTSFSRFNGRENVTISVQKQASANTIQVVNQVKKRLNELDAQLPKDIKVDVVYDQSDFIQSAINGVRDAAVQGGFLAFFVLLIFLRQVLTSTLVMIITPVTVLATFTLMYFMGISLNVISLGGIALGVGMLTDNAIVLIENAFRRFNEFPEFDFRENIRIASEEVIAPMFASTFTTIAVFLPMIFVTGIAGQIFKELAWVVVATQVISIIIAFTLLPVLMVKFKVRGNPEEARHGRMYNTLDTLGRPITWLQNYFQVLVPAFMKHRKRNLLIIFGLFVVSMFVLTRLDRVMMPKIDQGQFMIKVDMPVGTRVEFTNHITRVVEKFTSKIPEVKNISTIVGSSHGSSSKEILQRIGSHQAQMIVNLKPGRKRSTDEVVQYIRSQFLLPHWRKLLKGARVSYFLYESAFQIGSDESAPIVIDVKGNNMATLKRIADNLQSDLGKIKGVFDVSDSFPESSPETKINVNKDKASYYRLSVTDLATAAHISIKGIVATTFKEEGKELPVRVVLEEGYRDDVSKLPNLLMHSPLGLEVPLAELVTFTVGRGPSEIKRIGQERTIQVFGKFFGRSFKDVMQDVNAVMKSSRPPEGYAIEVAGASLEMEESFASLRMALMLSILLVYMIMAAQFESYFQPFIIMFTMPLALIGVALSLFITHTPVSVVVLLGVILLGGIVVNNGIILIDFANQMLGEGKPLAEAAVKASATRFRPIMMTAFSSILGLLPLAMGLDEGSKLQAPMAIAVMGGLLVATFLTLVVIPALLVGASNLREKYFAKKAPALSPVEGDAPLEGNTP